MSKVLNISIAVVLFVVAPAWADWLPNNPTDPGSSTNHKMHWPQLPDPSGLDVNFTFSKVLADDWKCSQTGPVDDIHFWMSTKYDDDPLNLMGGIHASIHADVPDPDGSGPQYSQPGTRLWHRDFTPTEYTVKFWGTGSQDFYDPNTGQVAGVTHNKIWQVNITGITNPFQQTRDTIYWLDLSVLDVRGEDPTDPQMGWKTTFVTPPGQADQPGGAWNDDAVWGHLGPGPGHNLVAAAGWSELIGPSGDSLDLAFVITPEPATLAVLALGAIAGLLRRRK